MPFRQLSTDGNRPVRIDLGEGEERRRQPARRLEGDRRPRPLGKLLPHALKRVLSAWQETDELVALRCESARDQRGVDRRWSGENRDGHPRLQRRRNQPGPGVGDAGQPRIGDEGDPLTALKPRDHLRGSHGLVVLVVGAQPRPDSMPLEQAPRTTRVLAEDDVGLGELTQHPQCHVLEIADRSRADREHQPTPNSSYATSAAPITPAAVPSSARTISARSRAGGSASRRIVSPAGPSRKSPADAKPPPMTTSWGRKMFTKLPIAAPSFRPIPSRISTAVESPSAASRTSL